MAVDTALVQQAKSQLVELMSVGLRNAVDAQEGIGIHEGGGSAAGVGSGSAAGLGSGSAAGLGSAAAQRADSLAALKFAIAAAEAAEGIDETLLGEAHECLRARIAATPQQVALRDPLLVAEVAGFLPLHIAKLVAQPWRDAVRSGQKEMKSRFAKTWCCLEACVRPGLCLAQQALIQAHPNPAPRTPQQALIRPHPNPAPRTPAKPAVQSQAPRETGAQGPSHAPLHL